MRRISGPYKISESHTTLPAYDRKPDYDKMKWDRDVMVRMRDGVHLCVDVYRPDADGKFPALLAISMWNKDLQTPDATENNGPQPAWSPFWFGGQEAGDSRFLTSRGYVHVVGNIRGVGKSEDAPPGTHPMAPNMDFYDLIEWIAAQPWCDGNVGMIGISAFAGTQWQAAMLQQPHLKAIFPYDAFFANLYRDMNPGGVLQTMSFFIGSASVAHENRGRPAPLPPGLEKLWEEAMNNPDYRMYGNLYNLLTMKGQRDQETFYTLVDPYEAGDAVNITEGYFKKIKSTYLHRCRMVCLYLQGAP
ncbi:MAG: hypothetical protein A2144_06365 [Chloroflexi bacterium RBG_16_50_9]|nr:MAG: hypothetical protein A2144_06365 [Chloroflexi bacterium RBG_16_50_9]